MIFLGDVMFGREEIVRNHHDVFTKWQKGTRMVVEPVDVRPIDDSSVVMVTVGGIGRDSTIPYDKLQTYTLRKDAGRWRCVAFHNTEMSRRSRGTYNAG